MREDKTKENKIPQPDAAQGSNADKAGGWSLPSGLPQTGEKSKAAFQTGRVRIRPARARLLIPARSAPNSGAPRSLRRNTGIFARVLRAAYTANVDLPRNKERRFSHGLL